MPRAMPRVPLSRSAWASNRSTSALPSRTTLRDSFISISLSGSRHPSIRNPCIASGGVGQDVVSGRPTVRRGFSSLASVPVAASPTAARCTFAKDDGSMGGQLAEGEEPVVLCHPTAYRHVQLGERPEEAKYLLGAIDRLRGRHSVAHTGPP